MTAAEVVAAECRLADEILLYQRREEMLAADERREALLDAIAVYEERTGESAHPLAWQEAERRGEEARRLCREVRDLEESLA